MSTMPAATDATLAQFASVDRPKAEWYKRGLHHGFPDVDQGYFRVLSR